MPMDASRNGTDVAFRTSFSGDYDLVQVFSGLSSIPEKNCPVDFRLAALQKKGHGDIWHMDQVLAFSTDECSPLVINGEDIGGNHGHPCAVRVTLAGHGKDARDIGSLWEDECGVRFTLLRIESGDSLLFLSENTGASETEYAFSSRIEGALHPIENALHTSAIHPEKQEGGVQLTPAIRHIKRETVCLKNGQWTEIGSWTPDIERAEIREIYEIINPATVAKAIMDARPEGGYRQAPSLNAGVPMAIHKMTYKIEPDGTVVCEFVHTLTEKVRFTHYLGIMHQEKCDLYAGGLWRYIPKLKPFSADTLHLDFSIPYRTTKDTLPDYFPLTQDLFSNPASPPDRQIDFIRRGDGTDAIGFACGFLPLFDGAPEKRKENILEAATLVKSLKTYPTFAGGMGAKKSYSQLKGAAYKKYFLPETPGGSIYTVPGDGCLWLYMDLFEKGHVKYTKAPGQTAELIEASAEVLITDPSVEAFGEKGYAVLRITDEKKKA